MTKTDLLIINAKQLICPSDDENKKPELKIIENGAIACSQGKIVAAGHSTEITEKFQAKDVFDATGKVVAPGFVDPHTHPVFFGTREDEFELRNSGKSYADIAKAGGGIRFSVRQLRQASKEQLIEHALPYLDQFIKNGTTTIEAKSGYGLTFNDEIKSLEVIRELNKIHPIDLVPTFLGAHEIPDEYRDRKQEYIKIVTEEMIPHVAEEGLAEFCDIFCESHVYNTDDTELILTAARKAGLKLKIHSDQLSSGGGTEIAAQLGAVSADHLDHVNSESIQSLKLSGTVPVLLPGAVFFLGLQKYAPARKMLDQGLPVALATDFNPGSCMTQSMPLMMTLASIYMGMKPDEVWLAATAHAARAISRSDSIGILKSGAQADIVIWNIPNLQYLPYHFGINHVDTVIKNGQILN